MNTCPDKSLSCIKRVLREKLHNASFFNIKYTIAVQILSKNQIFSTIFVYYQAIKLCIIINTIPLFYKLLAFKEKTPASSPVILSYLSRVLFYTYIVGIRKLHLLFFA